ncbi:MAG: energy transducer TonB [Bacteroidales bacterium]|nr:energy transducer TonB [Bacteroidales bacterium]
MYKLNLILLLFLLIFITGCSNKRYVGNTLSDKDQKEIFKKDSTSLEELDKMPQFGNGDLDLMLWITKNIKYPTKALKEGIEGTVVTRFCIDAKGNVKDVEVIQSVHPVLDKETVKTLKKMPKWKPGMQDGEAVPVYYSVPVRYRLPRE